MGQDWGFDGVSIMPILRGAAVPERGMGWLMGFQHGFPPWAHAYRFGKWKYVNGSKACHDVSCHTDSLFDLSIDLAEQNDLAKEYPEVLAAIKANFTEWFNSVALSRKQESLCGTPSPPAPPVPASNKCEFHSETGIQGKDVRKAVVES